ncbi:hydroxyethylthiazole kinase [Janibacter sp. G349]|uniref:hydroxyethylthiazole kinase n=1 Tax=unclassified Janibacter TaxID=2649294 RepID=UPI0020CFD1DC|nr:hydroxyethylthiazole kinase [Janibacter sp. CX7]UTT66739.1 hydroxyethylthiazole kinase [Janibacter sp. CX7]
MIGVARARDHRAEIAAAVDAVRASAPLVHGATGSVTRALVADGLLAAGARPMLTESEQEAPTLVGVADALLVNLGSLSGDGMAGLLPTARAAATHGVPWVLDPTAVGLAPVRTPLAHELLALGPTVVRGNASEVLTLAGGSGGGRGADSTLGPDAAAVPATTLARRAGCVVAVSGAVDLVTDGERVARIASGSPLLTRVSGTGCLLGALTAAHLPGATPFVAAVAATALLTVASDRVRATGPGSFRIGLLDALDAVTGDEVAAEVDLAWP